LDIHGNRIWQRDIGIETYTIERESELTPVTVTGYVAGRLWAFDFSGNLLWKYTTSEPYSVAIFNDMMVVGNYKGLTAFKLKLEVPTPTVTPTTSAPDFSLPIALISLVFVIALKCIGRHR
jgi:outer membrane protein assembly factor BamB